jgi:capsid portal protein
MMMIHLQLQWIKVYTDLQATGNGFLEIGRTVTGEIGYVGHIPATTVRVRRLRDGFVTDYWK